MWHRPNHYARSAAALLPGLGLALLAGCQGFNFSLERPASKVARVALTEQTDEGGRLVTTVRVNNPNRTVLPVEAAYYEVAVAGHEPFRFTAVPAVALPGEGAQTLTLPAAIATPAPKQSLEGRAYTVTGYASYYPPGEIAAVIYESGWPLPRTYFEAAGTLGSAPATQPR